MSGLERSHLLAREGSGRKCFVHLLPGIFARCGGSPHYADKSGDMTPLPSGRPSKRTNSLATGPCTPVHTIEFAPDARISSKRAVK